MNRGGFTVLEMVVALAVASVVALLVHRGFHTMVEMERRASEAREAGARAVAARRQVTAWLRAARVEGTLDSWDFEGVGRVTEEGVPDASLEFYTQAPGPFETGRSRLVLGIDRRPETPETGLVAERVDGRVGDPRPLRWVVVPGASGLVIRYLHTVDGGRAWTSEWRSSAHLPEAIEIRVLGDSLPPLLQLPVFVVPRGGV